MSSCRWAAEGDHHLQVGQQGADHRLRPSQGLQRQRDGRQRLAAEPPAAGPTQRSTSCLSPLNLIHWAVVLMLWSSSLVNPQWRWLYLSSPLSLFPSFICQYYVDNLKIVQLFFSLHLFIPFVSPFFFFLPLFPFPLLLTFISLLTRDVLIPIPASGIGTDTIVQNKTTSVKKKIKKSKSFYHV